MSYEPTNWQTGDVISAEKLNNLEQRAGGYAITPLKLTYEDSTYTIPVKWQELYEMNQSQIIFLDYSNQLAYISTFNVYEEEGVYHAYAIFLGDDTIGSITFTCSSPDEYPTYVD